MYVIAKMHIKPKTIAKAKEIVSETFPITRPFVHGIVISSKLLIAL